MFLLALILTVVLFVAADALVRLRLAHLAERKRRHEREEALNIGLRLDFAREARTLRRVTVDETKGSILAVDDEAVVLDTFRKILVLEGYSVDTVENGPEALALIRDHQYDFLFTDLKMPEMDGIEVTKAAKHLRPDLDVVVITGYASVESAVECMKYGALDYVQKPFTEEELTAFMRKCQIIRDERAAQRIKPRVHLVTASEERTDAAGMVNVPAGLFISPAHVWIQVLPNGEVRAGGDDFARKSVGRIDRIELPPVGSRVEPGRKLFSIHQGGRAVDFPAPFAAKVAAVNGSLLSNPEVFQANPYEGGWMCRLEAEDLAAALLPLKIGSAACAWYREEIDRLAGRPGAAPAAPFTPLSESDDDAWRWFQQAFLSPSRS